MINIRTVTPDEAPLLCAMSDSVNWNNSLDECRLLATSSNMRGFFLEVDGQIAGSAGMVTYEPQGMVFINMVIVKPEFRRRGYATMLIEHILKLTENYRTKRLHATPEGARVYELLGFKPCRTISFFSAAAPQLTAPENIRITAMNEADLPRVIEHDRECYGFSRDGLLRFNFRANPEFALIAEDCRGHIFGRRWKRFRQLSGLYSADLDTAMALTARAVALNDQLPISVITYDMQTDFQNFLRQGNFAKTRDMLDMVLGEDPPEPPMEYRSIYGGDMG